MANGTQTTPTRSAYLELKDERMLIQEGYEFLDEKRMIMAHEILRQLDAYRATLAAYERAHVEAVAALAGAAARHGLEGLSVYPRLELEDWVCNHRAYRFLGVELIDAKRGKGSWGASQPSTEPSPEAIQCRDRFATLLERSSELSAHAANMRRMLHEYLRTEQRARALENVLLPEIDESICVLEEQLEAIDQEEVMRLRFVRRTND